MSERKRDPMDQYRHCRNFNGVRNDRCKAGVSYRERFPPPWPEGALPCLGRSSVVCDSASFPTEDEARQIAAERKRAFEKMLAPISAAHADAKAKGFKKGNGGASDCDCPNCGKRLRYAVAASNGHMWARCDTEGCASWIE